MSALIPPALYLCARVFGGLLFGAAAVGKLRHRVEFMGVFENYRVTPAFATPFLAWSLILAEIAVAASLISGLAIPAGALAAMALLTIFAMAIALNVARGRDDIDCGCFQSAMRQQLSWALVGRNLAYVALLSCLLVPAPAFDTPLDWIDGVGAGLALFVLTHVFESLWALRGGVRKLAKRFG